jgi:arylsulfatase A-like enzyme/Flp pilus assembly protein TadD
MAKKRHAERRRDAGASTGARSPNAGSRQTDDGQPGRRRHWWIAAGGALVVVAAIVLWWLRAPGAIELQRTPDQNVLLITVDTLRADGLGCYGGRAATPNLDRLAALGVRFDFAHAQAVLTLPSHASILTGLYPFQHGIHDNAGFRLPDRVPTLASMLGPHGFATGAFIGAFPLDSRFGLNTGFDVYDQRYGRSDSESGFRLAERRADVVVAAAASWIGRQHGRWFAWVHVFDPHAPYQPPPPFDRQYANQPYYGEVAFTDWALGPLLDAARDRSGRPTLVVVTGDHGEGLGDHGEITHGLFAYEATLHVPLIVAQVGPRTPSWASTTGASSAPPGRLSSIEAQHVDVVPTILDALQLPVPPGLPGRSLLSASAARSDRASYFESLSASLNRGWAPLTGVLVDRQKYIDLPLPELYDLGRDTQEQVNLVDQEPDLRRVLEGRLRLFGPVSPSQARTEDPEAASRLRALGYVTGSAQLKARYVEADDPKRLIGLDQQMHYAVDRYEHGRLRDAVGVYRQVIAERPMEVAYAQLAMVQWDLGEPAEAIATLRAAIQAGQDTAAIRTKLGVYLAETGEVADALPLLKETTAGESPDLDALNALGIALGRSGRNQEAAAIFERMLKLDPSNPMAFENLGSVALREGRLSDARRFFSEALAGDPTSSQAHNGLGVVEMKSGNRKAAIEDWKQAVARDPRNFDALYNLATELVNDGQAEAARPYLEQFIRTAPPAFYAGDIRHVEGVLARLNR